MCNTHIRIRAIHDTHICVKKKNYFLYLQHISYCNKKILHNKIFYYVVDMYNKEVNNLI